MTTDELVSLAVHDPPAFRSAQLPQSIDRPLVSARQRRCLVGPPLLWSPAAAQLAAAAIAEFDVLADLVDVGEPCAMPLVAADVAAKVEGR